MKKIIIIVISITLVSVLFFLLKKDKNINTNNQITPEIGSIAIEFRVTGSVEPRNRLEIKPQVSGRLEEIMVVEGQNIKKGEVIAWMSSTDRAALLDAVRSSGDKALKEWEDIYKPTPIIAPIDGFIIARIKEPGQTVTSGDVIFVMADKLIIEATIDETDLRHIKLGQNVKIFLDAYPDEKFEGNIEHIAYESQVINNVTVYNVKILPLRIPEAFRAGMTATIEIVSENKDNILLLPVDAVINKDNKKFVMVQNEPSNFRDNKNKKHSKHNKNNQDMDLASKQNSDTDNNSDSLKDNSSLKESGNKKKHSKKIFFIFGHKKPNFEMKEIETGINNGKKIEIISGITENSIILLPELNIKNNNPRSGMRGGIPGMSGRR